MSLPKLKKTKNVPYLVLCQLDTEVILGVETSTEKMTTVDCPEDMPMVHFLNW